MFSFVKCVYGLPVFCESYVGIDSCSTIKNQITTSYWGISSVPSKRFFVFCMKGHSKSRHVSCFTSPSHISPSAWNLKPCVACQVLLFLRKDFLFIRGVFFPGSPASCSKPDGSPGDLRCWSLEIWYTTGFCSPLSVQFEPSAGRSIGLLHTNGWANRPFVCRSKTWINWGSEGA